MKRLLLLLALAGTPLAAQTTAVETASLRADEAMTPFETWENNPLVQLPAEDVDLAAFKWQARPIIVFADSAADPRFGEQLELLAARAEDLVERDVVLILDADPARNSDLRLKLRPRGFQLVLIGKDGGVKLRKPFPWSVRELSRTIDKMPMRQQEIRNRSLGN
jgi:hypothetical protein